MFRSTASSSAMSAQPAMAPVQTLEALSSTSVTQSVMVLP